MSRGAAATATAEGGGLTIQEFIDGMGWGAFNTQVLFQCGACWGADALEMMLVSFLGPAIDAHFLASRSPRYRSLVRGLLGGLIRHKTNPGENPSTPGTSRAL